MYIEKMSLMQRAITRNEHGLVILGVEAKVDEPFGPTLGKKKTEAPPVITPTLKKPPHEQYPYRDARPDPKGKQ